MAFSLLHNNDKLFDVNSEPVLPTSKNTHFQNGVKCSTFLIKMSCCFLHENKRSFPYQRLSTLPCFGTEAQGNSEMALLC